MCSRCLCVILTHPIRTLMAMTPMSWSSVEVCVCVVCVYMCVCVWCVCVGGGGEVSVYNHIVVDWVCVCGVGV